MHTARIPPVDPAPATIAAVLAMHAGHICPSSELLIRPRLQWGRGASAEAASGHAKAPSHSLRLHQTKRLMPKFDRYHFVAASR